jgi:hypothetical protein
VTNELPEFADWVLQNVDEIAQAQELTKRLYPDNPVELADHLSRAQSEYARMGYLLADCECYVVVHRASETIKARQDLGHLNGPERKAVVEAKIRDVLRMRDTLQVVVSSLKQKCFGAMNLRRVNNAETVQ